MFRNGRISGFLGALLCLAGLFVCLLLIKPGAMVDWHEVRAVALESDDWGFCGFVPDAETAANIDLDELESGRFPTVYLGSTLETAADVRSMAGVLNSVRDAHGLPAVFQPNYILSSLQYDPDTGDWRTYYLPDLPPLFRRPGLWQAVDKAIALGVWQPEYHGILHYDPAMRISVVNKRPAAARAAAAGVVLFNGSNKAFELGSWRDRDDLRRELIHGSLLFKRLFGRRPDSVIAPDYRWRRRDELMWIDYGFLSIQAKREQRSAHGTAPGLRGRIGKYLDRSWRRLTEHRIVYLERNCRLETAQIADPAAAVQLCLQDVRDSWLRGEPAIIETHRVNYVHTDRAMAQRNLGYLKDVLVGLTSDETRLPVFLTDSEIAMLSAQGVSYRRFGDRWILRNMTHSRRMLRLPNSDNSLPNAVFVDPGVHQY
jgi:hypothetical protein